MKSNQNVYQNYVPNQGSNRHMDFTSGNVNTSGYGKKTYQNLKSSQYNSRMMNKTRSTKHLLRSKNQSTNHAQNDNGIVNTFYS